MINNVVVVGRLVKNPEINQKEGGVAVTRFSLACGYTEDDTSFFEVVCFGKVAESTASQVKGNLLGVSGRLNQRRFTRKDGSNGSTIEIVADSVTFLTPKAKEPEAPKAEEIPTEEIPAGYIKGADGKLYKVQK